MGAEDLVLETEIDYKELMEMDDKFRQMRNINHHQQKRRTINNATKESRLEERRKK